MRCIVKRLPGDVVGTASDERTEPQPDNPYKKQGIPTECLAFITRSRHLARDSVLSVPVYRANDRVSRQAQEATRDRPVRDAWHIDLYPRSRR